MGRALIEGGNPLCVYGDIVYPDGGGLFQYPYFRGTLAKVRENINPVLPVTIKDIIFELEKYHQYSNWRGSVISTIR